MRKRTGGGFLVAMLAVTALGTTAWAGTITDLDQARREAEAQGKPVLMKVGAEWCSACNAFDKATYENDVVKSAIGSNVVLCKIDAEKGKGIEVARQYSVRNFPTFILMNAEGETMDRWLGYQEDKGFSESLAKSLEDPKTVSDRLAQFQKSPSEDDALKLGEIRHHEGMFAEAAAYYRRASELNPQSETPYESYIFNAMAYGNYFQQFSPDQVKAQANAVFASSRSSDKDIMKATYSMHKIAARAHDMDIYIPYLKKAIARTANTTDEKIGHMRAGLLPDYAILVDKNVEQAIAYKLEAQPEGWTENANLLNNYAWWCFEHRINLEQAAEYARKGIELAEAGNMKANILDTLAEICNASGDCEDAVDYIRLAVKEDPENEYFQKQLTRFEEILAAQR
ncbi:MAG: thioredoxin fold domain-containing protein [Gemmatimonadetes bacterium]|nr:thioredoxin fold domain-containing protein [Gemmatimonadota bacterium]